MFKQLAWSAALCLYAIAMQAQELSIKNNRIQRILKFDGHVWRTARFSSADGKISMQVKSEEFSILPIEGDRQLTISDFKTVSAPSLYKKGDTNFCKVIYGALPAVSANPVCPRELEIIYYAVSGQDYIRKKVRLLYDKPAIVDRLEVERFINNDPQRGGGRGEPVFINERWFVGLEYPAGYSRHTNGNTPAAYARYYDSVGNYSFIDLQGRDKEPHAVNGMIRLMHFPGYAVGSGDMYEVNSKTAVTGFARNNDVTDAFMQYIATIWKAPRSFVNYNNWFDKSAKDLSGDAFVNVYKKYKAAIKPYGITIDAMVPDDGWQDRKSIWQPLPKFFPNGDADLVLLSKKLQQAGVRLGLWLSINNYNGNVDWGVANGYAEAKRNEYFSKYGRYYSLSATKYKSEILKRVPEIAKKANLVYFKHDFNDLSDLSEGNNHPPTDRHGHEANLDVALQVLVETRKAQPEIFQNLTNWIWFSPWWLQYADYLWMLAGDDGENGNTPELSTKARFTTDRDTYIWRMFGNPADRPLVPVSRLMTHGILQTKASEKNTSIQDWMDYVLMHYGRGTLLKEWYISLEAMTPELWSGLASVHQWAKKYEAILNNVVFVGGRPDEGNAYGYMGWLGDKGILTVRNTSPTTQKLLIPFNRAVGFYGKEHVPFKATVLYPYNAAYPDAFVSGQQMAIEIPGYATMVFEFEKNGSPKVRTENTRGIQFKTQNDETELSVPADVKGRCELMVIGHPHLPDIMINGTPVAPKAVSKAKINKFAGYAKAGMRSDKATDWNMAGYDLLPYAGKTIKIRYHAITGKFESHLLAERKTGQPDGKTGILLLPNSGVRRQTVKLF